ncbi:Peptidase C14, caspase catalytic subunit p20 [Gloeomargarita lithophora Alchichica-D10]|uniref:Peptidase C14, caspase catalytic subunit p20 n=1 Tax=Gloeomargarita lithophora Alchichica-D10 TaxID=1188229 RepID=A0A1J0AED2_9CYAN|nr:caspase family protein [Gloeomargarita lithophora]APB34272.1 Peptidase C14, caspase catalytic subunit p20 [Gloeomargarita lithophora Alchichica-D10]
MVYTRRSLLQTTLLTLGGTLWRAQRVLADPGSRKLALLIGINEYPNPAKTPALSGCGTDVWLQQELLCGRLGFDPGDVLTLTDAQATGAQIRQAFQEHLRQQVRAGDVVILHFSGYGSRATQAALLPRDGLMTPDGAEWIAEAEVLGWLRQLATDRIITVLDTGYDYPGSFACGNVRVRACPPVAAGDISPHPNLRPPGVLFRAARPGSLATEALWPGFSAGTLTYALTQTLWGTTPGPILVDVAAQIAQTVGVNQAPEMVGSPQSLPPAVGAAGRVVQVTSEGVDCVLAGLPPWILAALAPESQLETAQGVALAVRSRQGLLVKTTSPEPVPVGEWVRERVRVVPNSLSLTVALAAELERIERVDATSALGSLSYVNTVKVGEQSADCLLGRVTPTTYGLFSPGYDLFPGTEGEADEAVKAAIKRLTPRLQTLLAAKLLQLTDNLAATPLNLTVTLAQAQTPLLTQTTTPLLTQTAPPAANTLIIPELPPASPLTCQISHQESQPLFALWLSINPSQQITLHPPQVVPSQTPIELALNTPPTPGLTELRLLLCKSEWLASLPPEPLPLAQAILTHLHQASERPPSKDTYALRMDTWAGLSLIYRVA